MKYLCTLFFFQVFFQLITFIQLTNLTSLSSIHKATKHNNYQQLQPENLETNKKSMTHVQRKIAQKNNIYSSHKELEMRQNSEEKIVATT